MHSFAPKWSFFNVGGIFEWALGTVKMGMGYSPSALFITVEAVPLSARKATGGSSEGNGGVRRRGNYGGGGRGYNRVISMEEASSTTEVVIVEGHPTVEVMDIS
ncbi:hypothetical protein FXO37_01625 [Capsicum annuum]|nr:hypothetical protein FXO37_01625 [Capsicum annuum]